MIILEAPYKLSGLLQKVDLKVTKITVRHNPEITLIT